MKILIEESEAKHIQEQIREHYSEIWEMLNNLSDDSTFSKTFVELDKTQLNAQIEALSSVLKDLKGLKAYRKK